MKQKELARWLKFIVIVAALICAVFLFLIAPAVGLDIAESYPEYAYLLGPVLVFLAVSAIPFYLALYEAYRVLQEIEKDNSFSRTNALHLRNISRLALIDTVLYFAGAVTLVILNAGHPSVVLATGLIIFIGIAATVAAAALSHLVQKAAALQDENSLTI